MPFELRDLSRLFAVQPFPGSFAEISVHQRQLAVHLALDLRIHNLKTAQAS